MNSHLDPRILASEMDADIRSTPHQNTPGIRTITRFYLHKVKQYPPQFVLEFARQLFKKYGHRWIAYEILAGHRAAFRNLGVDELEEFGQDIDSWWTVDSFARTLSGPAWREGQVPDDRIIRWAHSPDLWWRRAALVSTVALNVPSQGGKGDVHRTLAICILLVDDHEDMVVKAMSWALRQLVAHDPEAVRIFLEEQEQRLAARVKREVTNKLTTGLKNPGIRRKSAYNPP